MASKNFDYLRELIAKCEDDIFEIKKRLSEFDMWQMKADMMLKDLDAITTGLMNNQNRRDGNGR